MVNRRKFIKYSLIGTGVVSAGYVSYIAVSPFQKAIEKILIEDLDKLKVTGADIKAYARNLAESHILGFNFFKIQLIWLYHAIPFKGLPVPFKKRYFQIRSDIVGNFLLSTNFFYNKMDELQEIRYSGVIYNPYQSSCANPFSDLFYKQQ